jgi:hypothetical protein
MLPRTQAGERDPDVSLTTPPSRDVLDFLQQGKRIQAMRLYEREGATDEDINRLNTADSMARDRGLSIDEALRMLVTKAPVGRMAVLSESPEDRTRSRSAMPVTFSRETKIGAAFILRLLACAVAGICAAYGVLVLLTYESDLALLLNGGQAHGDKFWLAAGAFAVAAFFFKVA